MKTNIGMTPARSQLIGCTALASLGTFISLVLSILVGWQRGGLLGERLVWAAFGVLTVFGAHLLVALCRATPIQVRWNAVALWCLCMAFVAYSHASFFLLAVQQAGDRRADAVVAAPPPATGVLPGRSRAAIAAEQAKIRTELATVNSRHCASGCAALQVRRIALSARLDTLAVEADEARRREAAEDRQVMQIDHVTRLRDTARADPVTARLADLVGVPPARVNFLLGLIFAVVLEGLPCLCWYVVLSPRLPVTAPAMPAVTPSVRASHATVTGKHTSAGEQVMSPDISSEFDREVLQLSHDIAAGRLRATVSGIRQFCQCSQKKASAMRKRFLELNALSQA